MDTLRSLITLLTAGSLASLAGSFCSLEAQGTEGPDVVRELAWRVEQLRTRGSVPVGGEAIVSMDLTLDVYEQRGFRPVWTEPAGIDGLLLAIEWVAQHGLDPRHYHLSRLAAPTPSGVDLDPARAAELDLLRSDAFVRMSHDLRYGKVEPRGPEGLAVAHGQLGGPDAVSRMVEVATTGRVRDALTALPPQHSIYEGLVKGLVELRRIQSLGGWVSIPGGATMRPDSVDARVPLLRHRLAAERGFGSTVDETSLRFEPELASAVRSFQLRHDLTPDGLVGDATLAALNVPVDRRIDQVRVNMERARWIGHELPDTFVAVNVAGAAVYLLHGDTVAFQTRAIVGTQYRRTPLFTAPMTYIDLNPTWTVPASIVDEVLQHVKRDPTYLQQQGMRVLDRSGHVIDPATVDFSALDAASFPYVFRQDPGPVNPLGQIKLMLPNPHSVYLHDTPSKDLFTREERLFSHGCIRLEDPTGLAALVLGDPQRWNRQTLRAAIDTGVTQTLLLPKPVPVFVLYWTAIANPQGDLRFSPDVYDRDAAVLASLDEPLASGTRSPGSR